MSDQRSARSSVASAWSRSILPHLGRAEHGAAAGDHARGAQQAGDRVGEGGLAAAALAGEAEHLALVQGQVDVDDRVRGLVAVAVVDAQSAHVQQGLAGHRRPPRTGVRPNRDPARQSCGLRRLAGQPGRAQPRVDELVEAEVEQRQRRAEQRDGNARRQEPPPGADLRRVLRFGPEQHAAPAPPRGIDDAEEGQRHVGADRVEHGEHERRRDDRGQVRQDLGEHDPRGALTRDPRRGDVVASADGHGLRAQHPRSPRPAGDADDQREHERVRPGRLRQIGGQHDQQRQAGHDQEHVGEQGKQVVGEAAEIAGGHSDHDGQHAGDHSRPGTRSAPCCARRPAARTARPGRTGWCRARCAAEGPCSRSPLAAVGSCGASSGPNTASSTNNASSTMPTMVFPERGRRSPRCLRGAVTGTSASSSAVWAVMLTPPVGCAGRARRRPRRPAGWRRAPRR